MSRPTYCQVCGKDDCCLGSDVDTGVWHCTDCCNHQRVDFEQHKELY